MVEKPEYDTDPNSIGTKIFKGVIRQPILLDKDREDGLSKLNELIKSL